jgi:hypothetical protein
MVGKYGEMTQTRHLAVKAEGAAQEYRRRSLRGTCCWLFLENQFDIFHN